MRSPVPIAELRLLLIDADAERAKALASALEPRLPAPVELTALPSVRAGMEALRQCPADLVLFDLASLAEGGASAEDSVGRLVKCSEGALLIALSDDSSVSATVAIMRAGAHDAVARPFDIDSLMGRLGRLARRHGRADALAAIGADGLAEAQGPAAAGERLQAIGDLLGWPGDTEELRNLMQRLMGAREGSVGGGSRPEPILPMWRQEQRIIEDAIARCAGNISLAAAALELSPSTIYRKRQAWAEMEAGKGAA